MMEPSRPKTDGGASASNKRATGSGASDDLGQKRQRGDHDFPVAHLCSTEEKRFEDSEKVTALIAERDSLRDKVESLERQLATRDQAYDDMQQNVVELALYRARKERKEMAEKLHADCREVGHWRLGPPKHSKVDDWVDGEAFIDARAEPIKPAGPLKSAAAAARFERWKDAHEAWVRQEQELHQRKVKHQHQLQLQIDEQQSKQWNGIRDFMQGREEKPPRVGKAGRYFLVNLIGTGGFSEVFRAYDTTRCQYVACKLQYFADQFKDTDLQAKHKQYARKEWERLKKLNHPHIVQCKDVFEIDSENVGVVLELCVDGTDLEQVLNQRWKDLGSSLPVEMPGFRYEEIMSIAAQLAQVLVALAECKVIHNDLKPANILYDETDGTVKLADFGLALDWEESGSIVLATHKGTFAYLPEECFPQAPDQKCTWRDATTDTWSVGVILYELLYGRRPFGWRYDWEQYIRNPSNISSFFKDDEAREKLKNGIKDCYDSKKKKIKRGSEMRLHVNLTTLQCLQRDRSRRLDANKLKDLTTWAREGTLEWVQKNDSSLWQELQTI